MCILDAEASSEQFSRANARHADAMLLVVEPYFKSLESGRRMHLLAADLGVPRIAVLANKIRDEHDASVVRAFAAENGLEIAGLVPFDQAMLDADRVGQAPVDHAPDSPAVTAIGQLARSFVG